MNTAIAMLGANIQSEENLVKARERLSDYFEMIAESSICVSKPVGEKYKNDFHNQAVKFQTTENAKEVIRIFKSVEDEAGRTKESSKKGEVPMDIDLVFWNGVKRRNDYDRFPFVRQCIDEIFDVMQIEGL